MPSVALLLLSLMGPAAAGSAESEVWLKPWSAGGLDWGTSMQPIDSVPKARDVYLPDSGYVGRSAADKPDDLSLTAPQGEQRYLRYVGGQLVDAWWVVEGEIDVSEFAISGQEQWRGVVLGPGEDGFRSFGTATAWTFRGRTALHWKQRGGDTEILVSRAEPSGSYGVRRAEALSPGTPSKTKAKIKGDLARFVREHAYEISGCFEHGTKPIEAIVSVVYDDNGQPSRIKATTDQVAFNMLDCVAGAVAVTSALPGTEGDFSVFRLR